MLKAEELKQGGVIFNEQFERKILAVCGELFFVSTDNKFDRAGLAYTIKDLNYYGYKILEKPKAIEPQVGQVWESPDGRRVLITYINYASDFPIRHITLSPKQENRGDIDRVETFRERYTIFSQNQSREVQV